MLERKCFKMARISRVWSREIIDSRGFPTVETVVMLDSGHTAVASVPSGESTGGSEAVELRDNDPQRYLGKGVLKAVATVNQVLGPALVGMDPSKQFDIDQKLLSLDGTENKGKLGANSILSLSLCSAKAAALASNTPLYLWVNELARAIGAVDNTPPLRTPTPIFNMINGGLHGAGNLDFQEFQVIPASSKPYNGALQAAIEIYHQVEQALQRRGAIHSIGDEGGFAPNLFTNADALEILVEATQLAGYAIGQDVFLGLDVAANAIYRDGKYSIRDKSNPLTATSLLAYYEEINKTYRLTYLEDPLFEDDWEGWAQVTASLGSKMLVVGDDLLATNPKRVGKAIEAKACNAILVKPNQIGTVTETLNVIKQTRGAGWRTIVSHRSGETNDWFIADFAVGVKSDLVKFGAPARGERVAKYNRLLSIEAELAAGRQ